MSVSAMVEPFDAQMSDFIEDADMGIGPSTENWFSQQPSTHMDEDSNIADASDTQEIDMAGEIYGETVEYEMEEDTGTHFPNNETEVIDAEVYDAIQTSPLPPVSSGAMLEDPTPLENARQPVQEHFTPATEVPPVLHRSVSATSINPLYDRATSIAPVSDDAQTFASNDIQSNVISQIPETITGEAQEAQAEHAPSVEIVEHAVTTTEHTSAEAPLQRQDVTEAPAPAEESSERTSVVHAAVDEVKSDPVPETHHESLGEGELGAIARVATGEDSEPSLHDDQAVTHAGTSTFEEPAETNEGDGDQGELVASPEVHAPPPIFLSLNVTTAEGEQPEFVLFRAARGTKKTEDETQDEEPLVLLQHQPHLFYEPISSVFEMFRQEEYFSHIEELAESEMVLSANELQLSISEVCRYLTGHE